MNARKNAHWTFAVVWLLVSLGPAGLWAQLKPDQVVAELNAMRRNPASYAERLVKRRSWYRDDEMHRPGERVVTVTSEGLKAVDEAIAVLKKTKALPTLSSAKGLTRAAQVHARDLGRSNQVSHYGSDGSEPCDRMERYGKWVNACAETLGFAEFRSAEDVVLLLLIDDGVPDRGHRKALLDGNLKRVGVALGPHPEYGLVCVIDLAGGYEEK